MMRYAAETIWPLLAVALAAGFVVGILYWRARAVAMGAWSARNVADGSERIAELEAQNREHETAIATLTQERDLARAEAAPAQQSTVEQAELRTRLREAENAAAGVRDARARFAELEAEVARLRARGAQQAHEPDERTRARLSAAEARSAQLATRVEELEAQAAQLRERADGLAGRAGMVDRLRADLGEAERRNAALTARVTELSRAADRSSEPRLVQAQAEPPRSEAVPQGAQESQAAQAPPAQRPGAVRNGDATPARRDEPLDDRDRAWGVGEELERIAARSPNDAEIASRVLGVEVRLDDLKVVEGIGPKIEQICQRAGIRTWNDLAAASPEHLRQLLLAAGPGFRVHEPKSWPVQAKLLSEGRWAEFARLTEALGRGGRGELVHREG